MAHTIYENFYLSNEVEDQYNSHLDLEQFCTVDNSLVGEAGMIRKVNVYKATSGTEKLTVGQGNTKSIQVDFEPKTYEILLAQNKFVYYDEQEMADPELVPVGTKHMGTDMFNTVNADIYAEFAKTPIVFPTQKLDFSAFCDAQALLPYEKPQDVNMFAFVCAKDNAEIRKELGTSLQYVEAFARTGYVGTVAGINIYNKKDATPGSVYIATKEAVKLFNKKGTEIEQDRDIDHRMNTIVARKYYIAALYDETKDVRLFKGTATATTDTAPSADKTYYAKIAGSNGYIKVTPETSDNPKTKGWFEIA